MRERVTWCHGAVALAVLWACVDVPAARAYSGYPTLVPNGEVNSCLTCHNNPSGGSGCGGATGYPTSPFGSCLNDFGDDFRGQGFAWNGTLRDQDSDGDGRTNGQELVFFGSSFSYASDESATFDAYVTLPGWASGAPSGEEVHSDECHLQSNASGGTGAPHNYTNCSTAAATVCTNNSSSSATPTSTRYFGFSCSCSAGYGGNGRRNVSGDGVSDPGATGCSDIDECATTATCLQSFAVNSCSNGAGNYDCTCGAGFDEVNSGTSSENCVDTDECSDSTTCNEHVGTAHARTARVGTAAPATAGTRPRGAGCPRPASTPTSARRPRRACARSRGQLVRQPAWQLRLRLRRGFQRGQQRDREDKAWSSRGLPGGTLSRVLDWG